MGSRMDKPRSLPDKGFSPRSVGVPPTQGGERERVRNRHQVRQGWKASSAVLYNLLRAKSPGVTRLNGGRGWDPQSSGLEGAR